MEGVLPNAELEPAGAGAGEVVVGAALLDPAPLADSSLCAAANATPLSVASPSAIQNLQVCIGGRIAAKGIIKTGAGLLWGGSPDYRMCHAEATDLSRIAHS